MLVGNIGQAFETLKLVDELRKWSIETKDELIAYVLKNCFAENVAGKDILLMLQSQLQDNLEMGKTIFGEELFNKIMAWQNK